MKDAYSLLNKTIRILKIAGAVIISTTVFMTEETMNEHVEMGFAHFVMTNAQKSKTDRIVVKMGGSKKVLRRAELALLEAFGASRVKVFGEKAFIYY